MPSFRVQLNILSLRPGHRPEAVMATAIASLGERHHVEAHQVDIVAGEPRIMLRFTVEDDVFPSEVRRARESAALMRTAVEKTAATARLVVLRRIRGRWTPV